MLANRGHSGSVTLQVIAKVVAIINAIVMHCFADIVTFEEWFWKCQYSRFWHGAVIPPLHLYRSFPF